MFSENIFAELKHDQPLLAYKFSKNMCMCTHIRNFAHVPYLHTWLNVAPKIVTALD